jgi:hypothetical protein
MLRTLKCRSGTMLGSLKSDGKIRYLCTSTSKAAGQEKVLTINVYSDRIGLVINDRIQLPR